MENIISLGNSMSWHCSWFMCYTMYGRLKVAELVILGYGIRIKVLHGQERWGMARTGIKLNFYWKWHPYKHGDTLKEAK